MKKTLLKTLIILISVMLICMGSVQANVTSGYTFGINPYREDASGNTYAHTFQTEDGLKYIWNVQKYKDGIANSEEVFYCLAQGYGDFSDFSASAQPNEKPKATGGTSQSSYSGPYRLKDNGVQATLNSLYNGTEVTAFTGTTYNGLLWIFDNMYIPGEDIEEFLNKIPCFDDGNLEGMEGYTVKQAMETSASTEDDITEIDIQIAQQLAMWTLTNPDTVPSFPSIYLSLNEGALKTYSDLYTVEAPETGMKYGRLRNYCVKMIYTYLVNGANEAMTSEYTGDNITTVSVYANAAAQPVVTITREKEITGEYDVVIKKVDEQGNPLEGAIFTVGGKDYTTTEDGTVTIAENIEITENNVVTSDTYSITEKSVPAGYIKYDGTIGLTVSKKEATDGLSYIIDQATLDSTSISSGHVTINNNTNTITITVKNDFVKGNYSVRINKQNQKGEVLQGAVFTINEKNYTTDEDGYATIVNNAEINLDNVNIKDIYTMEEILAPTGYVVYDGEIKLEVTKKLDGQKYVLDQVTIDETSKASGKVKVEIDSATNTITVIIIEDNIDLALRKFISKIVDKNGTEVYSDKDLVGRIPNEDETNLKEGTDTTGEYNHTKQPVRVSVGDKITYTFRVYNEGESDAYITEITDYLSIYLEYVENGEWIRTYGMEEDKFGSKATTELATVTGASDNLQDQIGKVLKDGILLPAYDKVNDKVSYVDVQIICEVLQPEIEEAGLAEYEITNIAEITGMLDRDKNEVKQDIDSTTGNVNLPETEGDWIDYKEDEIGKKDYIPGQQDDDDFEKVLVEGDFDLALRKFITQVNNTPVNNRYPELSLNGDIKYTHTKEPVEVCYQDTVIYTIRIYNEGEIAGYANEITDDVPDGLEFIVDNEVNKEYRWVMLDENEEVTEDVTKAKYLVTDYLSEDQEKETGRNNLIKAFDKQAGLSEGNPDYRDVKIAFKVTYQVTSSDEESRILVNVAQISEDSNDDIDSIPNRDEEYDDDNEDDIDYDNVKVKYFDLSLLKWVTQAIVVENGETKIIETGHKAEDNPEKVVKVEIKSKDVKKVIVKFAYKIRITNEGEIAGYANEITDYIPEGLKFVQEDNPEWYERRDGVVATDQLKNTLLQPGESAEVEIILTWINGEKNLGTKINIAEISKDDNPSDTPDIDSTPDNEVPEEDDIDDAPVMLVIKTGIGINPQYVIMGMIVMAILISGTVAIKKFVL